MTSLSELRQSFPTVLGGIAISSPEVKRYGTLGCIVRDDNGVVYGLTAGHVLTNSAERTSPLIVHQAHYRRDHCISDNMINAMRPAGLDVIAFPLAVGVPFSIRILEVGIPTSPISPSVGMIVIKHGIGTGLTRARILSVDQDTITLEASKSADTQAFSGGDSGAIWVSESSKQMIALHIGADALGRGRAIRLDRLFSAIGLHAAT